MNSTRDHFDDIITETDTLIMRVKLRFADYIISALNISGGRIANLDVVIPMEKGLSWFTVNVVSLFIDDEDYLIYINTADNIKFKWDDLNTHSQQIVIDSLHILIRISQSLNNPPEGSRIN